MRDGAPAPSRMGTRSHARRRFGLLHRNACAFRHGIRFYAPRNIRVVAGIRVRALQGQFDHRKSMRTKNKSSVAIADLEKAWAAFYDATKVESEKDLAKQGWKTIRTIAEESKLTVAAITCRVETAIGKGILETKKATIQTNQGVREVKFFRPI